MAGFCWDSRLEAAWHVYVWYETHMYVWLETWLIRRTCMCEMRHTYMCDLKHDPWDTPYFVETENFRLNDTPSTLTTHKWMKVQVNSARTSVSRRLEAEWHSQCNRLSSIWLETWLMRHTRMCDLRHDSWVIRVCVTWDTHICVTWDTHICVTWDMTHETHTNVWLETWLMRRTCICDMRHTYMSDLRHDLSDTQFVAKETYKKLLPKRPTKTWLFFQSRLLNLRGISVVSETPQSRRDTLNLRDTLPCVTL